MRYTRWRSNPAFRSQVEQLFEAADEDSSGSIDDKEVDKLVKQMNILAAGAFLVAALTLPVSRINSCNQLCHEHFSPWPFAAGIFKSMKKSQGESFFEVAKPTATTATPLPSPREGTKSVTTKEETTLVSSEETNHFGPVPSALLAPARRSKAPRGGVWVFPRGPQASLGQSRRSAPRALAVAVRVV